MLRLDIILLARALARLVVGLHTLEPIKYA